MKEGEVSPFRFYRLSIAGCRLPFPPAEAAINSDKQQPGDGNDGGAMAGSVAVPSVMEYARKCGLFALELTGESAQIAESPEGFIPKVW
jgi:hypothetical protein